MTTNQNENVRMKLYGYPNSRATRAFWALEEAQAEYDYVHVDVKAGAAKDRDYLAINPGGKVPTLVDGDLIITESAAICLRRREISAIGIVTSCRHAGASAMLPMDLFRDQRIGTTALDDCQTSIRVAGRKTRSRGFADCVLGIFRCSKSFR